MFWLAQSGIAKLRIRNWAEYVYGGPGRLERAEESYDIEVSGHRFEPLAKDSVRFRFGQILEILFLACLSILLLLLVDYWLKYSLKLVN